MYQKWQNKDWLKHKLELLIIVGKFYALLP
jgi:hypothetical protein